MTTKAKPVGFRSERGPILFSAYLLAQAVSVLRCPERGTVVQFSSRATPIIAGTATTVVIRTVSLATVRPVL